MRFKIISIAVFIAAGTLAAQSPTPTPPGPAPQPTVSMTLAPHAQAALVAGQIIQQTASILNQVIQVLDNGIPAGPNQPAVSATDIQAALGTENVMKIRAAVAMLSGAKPAEPAPTATATPEPKAKP